MTQGALLGILGLVTVVALMAWFFIIVCKTTKSLFVRSFVAFGFLLILFAGFASIVIVAGQEGKEGLINFFIRLGETFIKSILKNF